ncbi:hypothetical protein WAI453_007647 [Rhynchosporium graminicola]
MPAIKFSSLLVREVHGVLAKRAVDHTVVEAIVVILVIVFVTKLRTLIFDREDTLQLGLSVAAWSCYIQGVRRPKAGYTRGSSTTITDTDTYKPTLRTL